MPEVDTNNIGIDFLFSNGEDKIYKVTWFLFSDLYKYVNGEKVKMNEVHVDVYAEDEEGNLERAGSESFLNIINLFPLPIRKNYLRAIGFKDEKLNNESEIVFKYKNIFFKNLSAFKGVYIAQSINNDNIYPVLSMHEVQQLINVV